MNTIKRSDFILKPFLKRNNFKAVFQLLTTLIPIISLWFIVSGIVYSPLLQITKCFLLIPVFFLLTLLSSRTFSLMHDCGHNSLFEKRYLNNLCGFFLGLLNGIPHKPWANDHAFHHRNNGNWEIYKGPVDVLSLVDLSLIHI